MVKRIVKIAFVSLIALYLAFMVGYVVVQQTNAVCQGVSVTVLDSASVSFVSSQEIKRHILSHVKRIKNVPINDINLERIEQLVSKYPAVAGCDAYFTPQGMLRVAVHQRKPVMRVFTEGTTYLLDPEGKRIPYRGTYSKRLLVVSGHLAELKNIDGLLELNRFVTDDSFWMAQIEQVYINSHGDLLLVPRVGDHYINVGDASDLEYKFRNLKALYKKGFEPREWNSYKLINLKYKGQIVCSKK
jgi:cell division protein FtsQ